MNRVIKFRIWDKKQNKLLLPYPKEGLRIFTAGGYLSLLHSFQDSCIKNENNFWENREDKDIVIQQFTGLYDLNGKEIYEGDILRMSNFIHWEYQYLLEVKFLEDNDTDNNRTPNFIGFNVNSSLRMIIVGNIMENKELLEEK